MLNDELEVNVYGLESINLLGEGCIYEGKKIISKQHIVDIYIIVLENATTLKGHLWVFYDFLKTGVIVGHSRVIVGLSRVLVGQTGVIVGQTGVKVGQT